MKWYKDLAINAKLMLLVLLASSMALTFSCVAFVANDVRLIRSSMVKQISALANVLGSNSTAALSFDDANTANELLNSLRQQPAVEFACIFDVAGKPFAIYSHGGSAASLAPPSPPAMIGFEFTQSGHLDVVHPIEHDGQVIGKIYLSASMAELNDQVLRYIAIVAVVMIVSLGSSIILSSRLQRSVSIPILELADAAQRVSMERDYGIRVKKSGNDEIGTLYDQFNDMLEEIQLGHATIQKAHDELEVRIEQRTAELSRANKELSRENAERINAERQLESVHQQLMDAARRAGMAEIATGVLHNVGNVLNSINVSATLVSERLRKSKVAEFVRATQMMKEHNGDLGAFLSTDPKGKQLPGYLNLLAVHFAEERADNTSELEQLATKVNHVKTIIATQQSYAGVSGVMEAVDIGTTLDDAMKLNSASFDRHNIRVVKEYQTIPKVRLDKQKVLQILVNLLNNARDAFAETTDRENRAVTFRTSVEQNKVLCIQVADNGMGIPPENLTRVFSHGFTTKKTGHGFGLHSCANAAKELGGSLNVHSDGVGKGATFTLKVPYKPVEPQVQS